MVFSESGFGESSSSGQRAVGVPWQPVQQKESTNFTFPGAQTTPDQFARNQPNVLRQVPSVADDTRANARRIPRVVPPVVLPDRVVQVSKRFFICKLAMTANLTIHEFESIQCKNGMYKAWITIDVPLNDRRTADRTYTYFGPEAVTKIQAEENVASYVMDRMCEDYGFIVTDHNFRVAIVLEQEVRRAHEESDAHEPRCAFLEDQWASERAEKRAMVIALKRLCKHYGNALPIRVLDPDLGESGRGQVIYTGPLHPKKCTDKIAYDLCKILEGEME